MLASPLAWDNQVNAMSHTVQICAYIVFYTIYLFLYKNTNAAAYSKNEIIMGIPF